MEARKVLAEVMYIVTLKQMQYLHTKQLQKQSIIEKILIHDVDTIQYNFQETGIPHRQD